MSGPRPMPMAAIAAQMPMAFARSARGKTLVMVDRVAGMISAPPTPIAARTAMRPFGSSTTSTATLAAPKMASPACRASLRPKRSPSVPMVSSRPANTSRYESTIHCRVEDEASNSD